MLPNLGIRLLNTLLVCSGGGEYEVNIIQYETSDYVKPFPSNYFG